MARTGKAGACAYKVDLYLKFKFMVKAMITGYDTGIDIVLQSAL